MIRSRTKAYINVIVALLLWGTIGVFRRNIPIQSSVLAAIRGFMGAMVLFVPALFIKEKSNEKISSRVFMQLVVSGGLLGANWILLFESYRYTTVAIATLCYYMQPTILMLLAPMCFGEKLNLKNITCMITSLAGMVLLSGVLNEGGVFTNNYIGILLGLGAALLYAIIVIMNKKLTVNDALVKTRIQLLSGALILTPYVLATEDLGSISLEGSSIIWIVIVGIVHTGLAYLMFYGNVSYLKAQTVAVLSYIDPVFALILSAVVLHENMTFMGIIGAVLIIGSAVAGELKFGKGSAVRDN